MSRTLAGGDWGDGYIVDIGYLPGYFRQQSPAHLNLACLLADSPESIQAPSSHSRIWSWVAAMGSRLSPLPQRTRDGE